MHVCVVFADRSHSYVGTTCLDIFSYYRLFVDDLIDTLGLKLYMYIHVLGIPSTCVLLAKPEIVLIRWTSSGGAQLLI